jgi:two-component system response regulator LytT
MRILIIENEPLAGDRLENMILMYNQSIEIVGRLESVKESVGWINNNPEPDLIFLDIHLDDDLSFTIFKEVAISCAIVFTVAGEEIATQFFQIKNVDFLPKPIIQKDLNEMIIKCFSRTNTRRPINPNIFDNIIDVKSTCLYSTL